MFLKNAKRNNKENKVENKINMLKISRIKNRARGKKGLILSILITLSVIFLFFQSSCCYDIGIKISDLSNIQQKNTQENKEDKEIDQETSETTLEEENPLTTPEPAVVSKLKIAGQAIDVKVLGGYAYLTNDLGTLFVIDVKDKENPKIVGKCNGIDSANIVMIQGKYAYISYTNWILPKKSEGEDESKDEQQGLVDDDSLAGSTVKIYSVCGFKIVDITDKKNPVIIGDYVSGNKQEKSVQGLVIDGDFAYLNTTNYFTNSTKSSLEIIDIKDKKNPKLVGKCDIEGQPNGLDVQGDYAYINNTYYDFNKKQYTGKSKLFVVNIKDKTKPFIIGSCEVFANSWSVLANGNYVYLSSSIYDDEIDDYKESMLQVIDVKEPQNPLPIGNCSLPGGAWELDIKDNFLFVSNNEGGVSVVNVSDPKNPTAAAFLSTAGNSYDIAISGDYGYIADGFEGLIIISLQKRIPGEGLTVEGDKDKITENKKPIAQIEVLGDIAYKDLKAFYTGNPVFFSAVHSYDPEGENLKYTWKINGKKVIDSIDSVDSIEDSIEGLKDYQNKNQSSSNNNITKISDFTVVSEKEDVPCCVFLQPGNYKVSLEVFDGKLIDEKTADVYIIPFENVINALKNHNFDVEIECIIENQSNIDLQNLECYIRTPLTYSPFQVINDLKINSEVYSVDQVFDNSLNMLTHIVFNKDLKVLKKQSFKTSITLNVTMPEYSFKKLEELKVNELEYEPSDEDLKKYTGEDLFIDIDSEILIDAVKKVVGNEANPILKAKKLYNFVTEKLYYDFPRAANKNYEFMSASEILKAGKGVCADYAILYVTLLRIAGIPARVVGGIPVSLMLSEKNKELDIGHAWVELKLPGYGWIPIDITQEEGFMKPDYFLNLATEKGTSFLYESQTMDWSSYYYDGFKYKWDGFDSPKVEQKLIYKVKGLNLKDLYIFQQ